MLAYVLNKHGEPLMPCKPQRARKLLKEQKAVVVNRAPFTIQLKYGSSSYKQPVKVGVDPGYNHVGISAVTDKQEVYTSDVELRTNIIRLLSEKRQYRRARRNRKTGYRKPRFNNRGRNDGWLAPSVRHKLETVVKLVNRVASILPITKVKVEVATFDIQKIKNPSIEGEEYQNGEQKGFTNVREYVLHRDNHTCQHCKGKSGDSVLQVHHIVTRKTGNNNPDNLMTVCKTCHDRHKKGEIAIDTKTYNGFKAESFMTTVRWKLVDVLRKNGFDVTVTYGYKTKQKRFEQNMSKSHVNDAYVIAGGNGQERFNGCFKQRQVRRQNRKLFKGARSHIRNTAERVVKGFRRFDKVFYDGVECFVWGRRKSGYFHLKTLDGTTVHASASWRELRLLECTSTMLTEVRGNSSPP